MSRRRRLSLAIAAFAVLLSGCVGSRVETSSDEVAPTTEVTTAAEGSGSETTAAPTTTQPAEASTETAIRIGLQLEPDTLDLTTSAAAGIPQALLYNVYETLVKLETDGSITPLLAESWDLSDDGTVYTFRLRQGVTFHNGDPLTADDVVFSLTNVLTKEPAHPFAPTLAPIDSVEAIDDSTVRVTLSRFSAGLLFFLTQGQGVILDERAIGSIASDPVGTGPFRFGSWTVGDSIVLERNDDYWGDPALLETVTFRYINDPNALNNALLAGDIDIIAGVSAPELLGVFEDDDRFEVLTGLTNGEVVLSLNDRNAPLDDVRVRRAISHAIDRQAVVDLAYGGYGEVIGTFSTPLDPWFEDLTGVYPYDPQAARDLLAEAGASDVTLEMKLPPVSYATRGGEIIASQLADVGITVNITPVEWGVWLEDVFTNHDYDMSIVAHVEPRDIGSYGNPDYYWGPVVADTVSAIVAEADAEPDEAIRIDLYRQALEEMTAQAADVWLFVLPALSVISDGITGYPANTPGLALDVTELAFNP